MSRTAPSNWIESDTYRRGEIPLVVPITLLRHHLRRHGTDWDRSQAYLSP
jgi:uncharacterized protein YbgA (DUF1722 family)